MPGEDDFSLKGFITQIDPPEHGRLRKPVSSAFTREVVADLGPRIAALTHELLDAARERDRFELVSDLAYPLPVIVIVIAELLGVPGDDRALFEQAADALFHRDTESSLNRSAEERSAEIEATMKPWKEMSAYLAAHAAAHAAERRRQPRADPLTRLVEAKADDERLPEICAKPGRLVRLAYRTITYRQRRGERKGSVAAGFKALLHAAHAQLGGPSSPVWDSLPEHVSARMRQWVDAQADWLLVDRPSPYTPDLNAAEGIWSDLRITLLDFAVRGIDELTVLIKDRLKRMRYQPVLLTGCLAQTGLMISSPV
ncbi:hypothetical protein AB0J28_14125 [Streptosporangium canum]|uniref:hypothetical protein n=1 Tax=Streptosporangium canum TaxID=324952 RepID=UPI00342DD325